MCGGAVGLSTSRMACMMSSCSASFSSFVRPILPAMLRTAAAIVEAHSHSPRS